MIERLIKKGLIEKADKENVQMIMDAYYGTNHDFGGVIQQEDYESDGSNQKEKDIDTGSETDYSTDEVHDTRSLYIGYYRGPSGKEDSEDDSFLDHYQDLLINDPDKILQKLETNLFKVPESVRVVKKIALGHEHMIALVECEQFSQTYTCYGMGNNIWGQLGRDPFQKDFIDQLVHIRPRILGRKQYQVQQIECGSFHTLMLVEMVPEQEIFKSKHTKIRDQKVIQFGNVFFEKQDEYVLTSENRNIPKSQLSNKNIFLNPNDVRVFKQIEKNFKGKVIDVSNAGIKFIRAAYGRSMAVTKQGQVFIWGLGFRSEALDYPLLLFQDTRGIFDIKFGRNHGVYI